MECSIMHTTELYTSISSPGAGLFLCSMGDRQDSKNIAKTLEMENLSLDISTNRFSRDLLQRFMGSASQYGAAKDEEEEEEEEEEVELNLGLSMGGRFGVNKSPKKLVRSSSIASCLPVVRDDNDVTAPPPAAYTSLARASSLPVETEEEWRKRKELQTLRRMEAKRRRSEKQRSLRSEREGGSGGSGSLSVEEKKEIEVNLRAKLDREKSLTALKRSGSSLAAQFGLSTWAATAGGQALLQSGSDVAMGKGKGRFVGNGGGGQGFGQPSPQGSIESKGGSSSSVTDLESKNLQGTSGELSPGSIQSAAGSQDIGSSAAKARETTSKAGGSDMGSPSKRSETSRARGREIRANSMEDMPCVFTKGDGPNGRRVDGILYKYGKGEDVRIMCICHGSFHSPAEFVKHAGGTNVGNPLKHIVVNPNSSSLL